MMKRYLMVAALALVLAGCGSNVKLDPPIEGSPTTGVGAAGAGDGAAAGQGVGQSTVTQVQAGGAGADRRNSLPATCVSWGRRGAWRRGRGRTSMPTLQSVAYIMRLADKIFELPNVVEDSNLPLHLPNQRSDPVSARGPLDPACPLCLPPSFY